MLMQMKMVVTIVRAYAHCGKRRVQRNAYFLRNRLKLPSFENLSVAWPRQRCTRAMPPLQPCNVVQFISLLAEIKTKYRTSNEEFNAYLQLFCLALPNGHSLPTSFYRFRKRLRGAMNGSVDKDTMWVRHLCSSRECDYMYTNYPGCSSDTCPRPGCGAPRYRRVPPLAAPVPAAFIAYFSPVRTSSTPQPNCTFGSVSVALMQAHHPSVHVPHRSHLPCGAPPYFLRRSS